MNCPKCKVKMDERVGPHHYVECGLDNVWIENCRGLVCPVCKGRAAILPNLEAANRLIARELLVQKGRLDADAVLFLREAMGLTARVLAEKIGVHRVEVSRWENGKAMMDPYHEFKLRLQAVDRFFPEGDRIGARETVAEIFGYTDVSRAKVFRDRIRVDYRQAVAP